jgi:hypothetical protein
MNKTTLNTTDSKLFSRRYNWRKQGLLITPQKDLWWMQTHAMIPTVDKVGENLYRVYFSGRDKENRSHIGYAVVQAENDSLKVLSYSDDPVITLGDLGCFDDNGVTPSCMVTQGDRKFFYYIGWNAGSTVRMHLFGGLALSDDGGKTFTRYSKAPIIERNRVNPLLNTAPYVVHADGEWRMYYVSGVTWVHRDLPRYNIQTATSQDGLEWHRDGRVCIDFASPSENALARPFVIVEDGVYKMWFAHKGDAYRLGYAESLDGVNWQRRDELSGIDVSSEGWDSDMIEYACVFENNGQKFMLYNGNNYGFDGAGWAVGVES